MRRSRRSPLAAGAIAVALAGTATGAAAAAHVGPFAVLGTSRPVAAATAPALPADRLYPSPTAPPPTQRVQIVVDPPAEAAPPASGETSADGSPAGTCWDDCGGWTGDGGGEGDGPGPGSSAGGDG